VRDVDLDTDAVGADDYRTGGIAALAERMRAGARRLLVLRPGEGLTW